MSDLTQEEKDAILKRMEAEVAAANLHIQNLTLNLSTILSDIKRVREENK